MSQANSTSGMVNSAPKRAIWPCRELQSIQNLSFNPYTNIKSLHCLSVVSLNHLFVTILNIEKLFKNQNPAVVTVKYSLASKQTV